MLKKRKIKLNLIILTSFVLGIIIATQLEVNRPFALISLRSIKLIENQIDIEKEHISSLEKIIGDTTAKIKNFKPLTSDNGKETIEKIIFEKKALSGELSIIGEGIRIKVGDSKRELKEGENPNNLVVHDQDILMLVNELKVAGAEAMAINGERLTANTEIKCSGATITINGKTFGQPFIIYAIGNKELLSSAVLAENSYGYLLKQVYALEMELENKQQITIPAYNKIFEYKYREDEKL